MGRYCQGFELVQQTGDNSRFMIPCADYIKGIATKVLAF